MIFDLKSKNIIHINVKSIFWKINMSYNENWVLMTNYCVNTQFFCPFQVILRINMNVKILVKSNVKIV